MKKKFLLALLAVLAMVLIAACGNGNGGTEAPPANDPPQQNQEETPATPPVTGNESGWQLPDGRIAGLEGELIVAGAARQFNVSDPDLGGAFEYFQEFYPNFRTTIFDRGNEGGALGHLQTLIAAGTPPDVYITDSGDVRNLVRLGMIEDITGFFDVFPEYHASLIPQATDLNTVDGRIYGVTWQLLPRAWITNVDLFERMGIDLPGPDWTVDDFIEINARFGANRSLGISGVQGEQHIIVHQFLMAFNITGSTFEGDLELSAFADDPNAIRAVEAMIASGVFDTDTQFTGAEIDAFGPWPAFFTRGHSAWQPWSVWGQPINRQTGEILMNWTVLPPPRGPEGHRGGNSGTITMALFPGTPNADLAFKYIMASTSQHFVENAYVVNMGANPPAVYPAGFRADEIRFPVGFPPVAMNHVTHPDNAAALAGWELAVSYMVQDPFSVVGIMNNHIVAYVIPGTRSIADMLREYDNWRNGYLRAGQ
ncbi:MAG: extracellular solute-binding protein [Defluviitaleaceae bacterium]|nr:extracellular solute-binding protein [Defluviitaleaceae bacterium]